MLTLPRAVRCIHVNANRALGPAVVASGCAIAWGLAIVGTLIILKVCDLTIGVRVTTEQEVEGLDLSMHGEEGYILES